MMASASPLVSLILCVKNGMPYLPEAVASVLAQSYRNLELIVQDGASTDGSLELLQGVRGLPNIHIESARDAGVGQAYNRAICRCNGALVGSIDADNLLEKDAVAVAVRVFERYPGCAAVYGATKIIDGQGHFLTLFQPDPFDPARLMKCDLVPPFAASFFSRHVCGEELRFDEGLETCADFDLWLRISHLPILRLPDALACTRVSEKSMTRRAEGYDQYCKDKMTALSRFLARCDRNVLVEATYKVSAAGIYSWAAESILSLEGRSERFQRLSERALELDPSLQRLSRLFRSSPAQE
jgi:glycosyltransferase involved in cell wall biosynthesis